MNASESFASSSFAGSPFVASAVATFEAGNGHLGLRTFLKKLTVWLRETAPEQETALAQARWVYDNLIKPFDSIPDMLDDMFVWPAIRAVVIHFTTPAA